MMPASVLDALWVITALLLGGALGVVGTLSVPFGALWVRWRFLLHREVDPVTMALDSAQSEADDGNAVLGLVWVCLALRRAPGDLMALTLKGELLRQLGRGKRALACFQRVRDELATRSEHEVGKASQVGVRAAKTCSELAAFSRSDDEREAWTTQAFDWLAYAARDDPEHVQAALDGGFLGSWAQTAAGRLGFSGSPDRRLPT